MSAGKQTDILRIVLLLADVERHSQEEKACNYRMYRKEMIYDTPVQF